MQFETNVWDNTIEWNSLIHPQLNELKDFKPGKKTVRRKLVYRDRLTGELEFDLKAHMRTIRKEMADDQDLYDKIKGTDVPYRWVVFGFVVFLVLMGVGSYIG